jgi:hypothetical protein
MGLLIFFPIYFLIAFGVLLLLDALLLRKGENRSSRALLLLPGLLALILLLAPLPTLVMFYQANFYFGLLVVPILLVLCALLIANAFRTGDRASGKTVQEGPSLRFSSPLASIASLILGMLLLMIILYRLYWFLVWDSTYDPLGLLLIFPLMAVAVACGLWLALALPKGLRTLRLLFLFAFPLLVFGTYDLANQVDFRQLSDQRLGRVGQAVEAYHAREGRYPQDLGQLVPLYLLSVPRPVFIHGQDWCYQPAEGSFQLAYLTRDHWSSPYLSARAYHSDSDPAQLELLCAEQITSMKQRNPWVYWHPGE